MNIYDIPFSTDKVTRKSASPMYLGLAALGTFMYLGLAALGTFLTKDPPKGHKRTLGCQPQEQKCF